MERSHKEIIAALAIALIAVSIVMPSILYFRHSNVLNPEDAFASATVSLNVVASEVPGGGGDTGGGGGGGGGISVGSAGPKIHLLDFSKQEEYSIFLRKGDKIKALFEGGLEYNFDVSSYFSKRELALDYKGEGYRIIYQEIAYFDLDVDGKDDMSVYIREDASVKFTALQIPGAPGELPKMSKEQISFSGFTLPGLKISLIFIFILVAVAFLIILVYHQLKLKRIEKTHKGKIKKIYVEYKSKKGTSDDKKEFKDKLSKQQSLLTKAYKSGYVSKDSYLKGKKRIGNLMRKS